MANTTFRWTGKIEKRFSKHRSSNAVVTATLATDLTVADNAGRTYLQ